MAIFEGFMNFFFLVLKIRLKSSHTSFFCFKTKKKKKGGRDAVVRSCARYVSKALTDHFSFVLYCIIVKNLFFAVKILFFAQEKDSCKDTRKSK